jgi:hypothetical protein
MTKLDTVFKRARIVAVGASTAALPPVEDTLTQKRPVSRQLMQGWSFTVPIRSIARPPFPR